MKKFLTKVLTYMLILLVLTEAVNAAYLKMDRSDDDHTAKFRDIPSSLMICNFGSSHGLYGFNYQDITDVKCFNFSLEAQMFSYDERLFQCYEKNISPGAVCLIPVSYFSFFGCDETDTEEFDSKNRRYYRILPKKLIKNYELKTDIYTNCFPSLLAGGVRLIETLAGRSENTDEINWSRRTSPEEAKADAAEACRRHLFTDKLDRDGNRIFNQKEADALIRLIDMCSEKGFTPILITTPFLREYTDEVMKQDPWFMNTFHEIVMEISEETGAAYYDYALDERFRDHYAWFMNSDHLNKEGARVFTGIVMEEIISNRTGGTIL